MKSGQMLKVLPVLLALLLTVSCRSLENGKHKDWATVDIRVNHPNESIDRNRSVASSAQTALIIAIPQSGSAITSTTDLSVFYDRGLQDLGTGVVTLSVPLNEPLQLVKKTFNTVLTLAAAAESEDFTGIGASESFVLTGDVTSKEVAIALESVGGWTFADGDGAAGINKDSARSAVASHMAVYNTTLNGGFRPTLIAAWSEESASNTLQQGYGQVRVAAWDNDSSWTFIDGDGQDGLNEDVTRQAESVFLYTFDDKLFLAFNEYYNASRRQIQVQTWDGYTWECQGGCGTAPDINVDNAEDARVACMVEFDSTLFIAWNETYSGYGQIRVKKFNGGASWSFAEQGDPVGINKQWDKNAQNVQLVVFNSKLYAVWQEEANETGDPQQIRIAEWDGSTGWTFKDGDGTTGLNYDVTKHATDPIPLVFDSKLYIVWVEKNASDIEQIRVKAWDGTTWQFVDGNGVDGLNRDSTKPGLVPTIFEHNSKLHVAWSEPNTSSIYQLRVAQWDGSSTWSSVDGDDDETGLNKNSDHSAIIPRTIVFDSSLFMTFMEGAHFIGGDSTKPDQIRIIQASAGL